VEEVQDGTVGDVTGVDGARNHRESLDVQQATAAHPEVHNAGDQEHQCGGHFGEAICGLFFFGQAVEFFTKFL